MIQQITIEMQKRLQWCLEIEQISTVKLAIYGFLQAEYRLDALLDTGVV